ncbi:mitogen-activated protein kinase kinase kinase 5-like [Trifolium pratense]|uniref:mitogen-activated protein kinase kinase kinase 5-like n=1 Tax=Trifolium pratense TaxID=57577 RepID=UPI001E6915FD|nr:mitogen-activated protein kinase kinase kinase 5-like [Trifolium pratense]
MTMRMPAKTARSPDLSPRRSLGNHSPNYRHTIQDFNDVSRLPAKTTHSPDLSPRPTLGNHCPDYHHTIQDFNDVSRLSAKTTHSPDLSPRRSLGNCSPNYRHIIQDFNDVSRLPAKTTRSPELSSCRSLGNHSPDYRHTIQDFNDVSRFPAKTTCSPELSSCRSLGNLSPDYRHTIQDCNDILRLPTKTACSPDLSPRHSSGNDSPNYCHTIQGGSHSHHSKYFTRVWLENNHVDGYPLPLPPRASPPPQQSAAQHQTNVTLHHSTENFHSMKGQWQKGKLIGRESLGSVYMATNIETGTSCAMKEVDLLPDDPKFADCIKQLHQEIRILGQLHHPNIVQYYGSDIVGDRVRIYMEYVQLGSLNKFMHEHSGAMTESVVCNFTRHILSGLAYLHSTKTIHRDIKCANLLVDASGIVKLAGFRMSKILTKKSSELLLNRSPYWMAPELMVASMKKATNPNVAMAVDIWSLGCTVIEMLTGKPPWSEFSGHQAMFKALHRSPDIPKTLSPEGHDFLEQCFRRNPVERPSAAELLTHAFVQKETLDPKRNHVNIFQEAAQKITVV